MGRIYGMGETVLDIIFKDGEPKTAKPGGSVLNSLVSIGRTGQPVSFLSEYGTDNVGDLIHSFLINNGIDTSFVVRNEHIKTTVSMAFLNDRNDASYSFYKDNKMRDMEFVIPDFKKDDILQFGSFYAINPDFRKVVTDIVGAARGKDILLFYDPNFRAAHLADLDMLKSAIIDNMKSAGIVKGSDEDFKNIFDTNTADEAWEVVRQYTGCLVYTANVNDVHVRTKKFRGRFPVSKIKTVSTIGAGDNFNAGMLAVIGKRGYTYRQLYDLQEYEWTEIINMAIRFASHVCMSYENYISKEFAEKIK